MTAAPAIKARLKLKLKVVAGPHLHELYGLDQDQTRIGRGEDNQIRLVQDSRVSRNHVLISWTGTTYRFKNLSQKNFIMLDGQVLEEGDLKPGDKLQIGETLIEVFEEGPILVPQEAKPSVPPSPLKPVPHAGGALKKIASAPAARVQSAPLQQPQGARVPPQRPVAAKSYRSPQDKSRANFYIILGLILLGLVWLVVKGNKPKEIKTFRNSQQIEYDLLQSEAERKRLEEKIQSQKTEVAKRAQENLIKGFRDYQQGNFARARDNFQVVLNLDPDNEVAKRYYHLSRIKFDEMLQFHMLQGLRYRDKRNFRMCRSNFQSALIMIQNNSNHPKYREIKNFFDECNLAIEGRF